MSWRQVLDVYDLLDSAYVDGPQVWERLKQAGIEDVTVTSVEGPKRKTDFVKAVLPGARGRLSGGSAPTLAVIGGLSGIGARPERIGFISDGDGALAAISVALKLASMQGKGDVLLGDVIVATQICPNAPTLPRYPTPYMDSPVDAAVVNSHQVDDRMEAILSIETTKRNRIINHRGFAISPTVREGYVLRVSEDLLDIMQDVTGRPPAVLPITTQDITPYGNGVYHINSIMQPATATSAPVVGVAITSEMNVAGCSTGATQLDDVESAVRFAIEVAKAFGAGKCQFMDEVEYGRLVNLYGLRAHLQAVT